ncbi:hypothetical protein J3459_008473 [Metarhizium acridum]|uniref:Integral membrane protein n=1 Tax=Metarhizium acridum (strain CQMa 102) TaxID=655827 RepID=E9EF92_METAQ|nr:uncharacterized protein MAC_08540 [Metarhizium acridum CQMa 102]EFY85408.1 integral membrane protein [Metarhizium acridum CQMa 102]KAG8426072.1 hypothetical protein J3459_008473 [Metarhizium acridum]
MGFLSEALSKAGSVAQQAAADYQHKQQQRDYPAQQYGQQNPYLHLQPQQQQHHQPCPLYHQQTARPPSSGPTSWLQDSGTSAAPYVPILPQPVLSTSGQPPSVASSSRPDQSITTQGIQAIAVQASVHHVSGTPRPHPCGITPITECCNTEVLFPLDWFTHSCASSFTICSCCYVDYVYNSPFRFEFTVARSVQGESRRCMFGSRRMKETLWPQTILSGNLSNALEFMKKRQDLPACPESQLQQKRNRYVSNDIPGATICEACFEDNLMHTPFGFQFKLQQADTIAEQWYCDLSVWFIPRTLEDNVGTGTWDKFCDDVKARLQMPQCPKLTNTIIDQRGWYIASRGPPGLQVCHTCFCDYFFGTPAADFFSLGKPEGPNGTAICVMGHLNILLSTMRASSKQDWQIFWAAMDQLGANPICSGTGTTNAVWFTTKNNPPDFAVCGACIGSIATVFGGAHHFMPKPGTSRSDTFVCNFNTSKPRWQQFLANFNEVVLTGKPDSLELAARTWASVPLCPRYDLKKPGKRKWWGWDDLQICEECYISFAKGSRFEARFPMKGLFVEKSRICDLYSPRMRGLYTEACQNDALPALLDFAHKRRLIFLETIPHCEEILMAQFMKAQQAKMLGITGSFYKAMGGAQAAINGHDYNVGNAQVGYGWKNETEFTGAMYDHHMRQVAGEVGSGGPKMMIRVLEQRWKQVE